MKSLSPLSLAAVALAALASATAPAQSTLASPIFVADTETPAQPFDAPSSSSSSISREAAAGQPSSAAIMSEATPPFFYWGIALKFGADGVGIDLSAPLSRRVNLRTGASFFIYNTSLLVDGATISGSIKFQNASGMVDFFPFRNRFRVSTGLSFYNNTGFNASLHASPGQSFSLNNTTYTSSPGDPIHGSADFNFGSRFAPRFTFGFGNMLPKQGRFAIESEFGFEYISQPIVSLQIAGTGCTGPDYTNCGPIDQSDVRQQQFDLQSDVRGFSFYPIFSVGLSYKIGPTQPKKHHPSK